MCLGCLTDESSREYASQRPSTNHGSNYNIGDGLNGSSSSYGGSSEQIGYN